MNIKPGRAARAAIAFCLWSVALPAMAGDVNEKLFLAALLKHIGAHVCTEPISAYKREFAERLAAPNRVEFRNVNSKWEDESTGRLVVKAQARFHFDAERHSTHDVYVSVQPKGGMFEAKGPWIFFGDMDYDYVAGSNLGGKGGMDCSWSTGSRRSYYKIPPLEFAAGYKD